MEAKDRPRRRGRTATSGWGDASPAPHTLFLAPSPLSSLVKEVGQPAPWAVGRSPPLADLLCILLSLFLCLVGRDRGLGSSEHPPRPHPVQWESAGKQREPRTENSKVPTLLCLPERAEMTAFLPLAPKQGVAGQTVQPTP